jgi:DHA1 family bicyclomycin/chloramphenicol resistance-like MFS transporter
MHIHFATLFLLATLSIAATDMYLPSLPAIGAAFSLECEQVQFLQTIYLLGFSLTIVFFPFFSSFGKKRFLLASILLFSAASLYAACGCSYLELLFCRFLQSLGGASSCLLSRTLTQETAASSQVNDKLNAIFIVVALAMVAAPIAGGGIQHYLGWKAQFLFQGGYALLLASLSALFIQEPESLQEKPLSLLKELYSETKQLWQMRSFYLPASAMALIWGCFFLIITQFNILVIQICGFSSAQYGWIQGFILLGFILGSFLAKEGFASIYQGSLTLLTGGGLILSLLYSFSFITLLSGAFCAMVGVGILLPLLQALALKDTQKNSTLAFSSMILTQVGFGAVYLQVSSFLPYSPLYAVCLSIGCSSLIAFLFASLLFTEQISSTKST